MESGEKAVDGSKTAVYCPHAHGFRGNSVKVRACAIITDLAKRTLVSGETGSSDGASVNSTAMWKVMPCNVAETVQILRLKAVGSSETSAELYHTTCVSHPRRQGTLYSP